MTYNVSDAAGNPATQVTRTVNVTLLDITPPVITLLGVTPVTIAQGSVYTDAGATALDNVDGNITANIVTVNNVNTAAVGTYSVTYNVSDAAGNAANQVTRTVNVSPAMSFRQIFPSPSAGTLRDLAWNNVVGAGGVLVAVGDGGAYSSLDGGVTWTQTLATPGVTPATPISTTLFAVSWGAPGFVAVGQNGAIYSSANGTTWARQISGTITNLTAVTWGAAAGKYVAIGSAGKLLTSPDGVTWTVSATPAPGGNGHLTYGLGLFIGVQGSAIITSVDGLTWTAATVSPPAGQWFVDVIFTGTSFIAVGNSVMYTSATGTNWAPIATPPPLDVWSEVVSDGGTNLIVLASFGAYYFSADGGGTWSPAALIQPGIFGGSFGAVWNGNQFISVGNYPQTYTGVISAGPAPVLTWTSRNASLGSATHLNDIKWGGGVYVAVGANGFNAGAIKTSTDGLTWRTPTFPPTQQQLNAVTWNGTNQFAAVGRGGMILTSSDAGVTWIQQGLGVTANDLNDIIWDGGQFVAVGNAGTVLTSPNGVTWTLQGAGATTNNLTGIAWSGTQYVASMFSITQVLTSVNATVWTAQATSPPLANNRFGKIVWDGSQYVGISRLGATIQTSPNGLNWTIQYSTALGLNDIIWTGTELAVVGGASSAFILTSSDGINWNTHNPGSGVKYINGIAKGAAGQLVAVGSRFACLGCTGEDAMILVSP